MNFEIYILRYIIRLLSEELAPFGDAKTKIFNVPI